MMKSEYRLMYERSVDYVEDSTEIQARKESIRILKKYWRQLTPVKDKYGKIPERAWGFRDVKVSKAVRIKGIRQYIGIGMVLYDPILKRFYWMIYGDKTIRILDEEGKIKGKV